MPQQGCECNSGIQETKAPGRYDSTKSQSREPEPEPLHAMSITKCKSPIRIRTGRSLKADSYFGCSVCAIITWRLNSSTIFGSRRTAVGFLASVMVSILSCSLSSE
jgi:hypothetical protein